MDPGNEVLYNSLNERKQSMKIGDIYINNINGERGTILRFTKRAVVIAVPTRLSGKVHYERFHFDYQLEAGSITILSPEDGS